MRLQGEMTAMVEALSDLEKWGAMKKVFECFESDEELSDETRGYVAVMVLRALERYVRVGMLLNIL